MDAKQRHRIEIERVSDRIKLMENIVNDTKNKQIQENESLAKIQSNIEIAQSRLFQIENNYKELELIIDETINSFNTRINQYNDHINKLNNIISDIERTIDVSNKILEENQNEVIKLKFKQQDIQNRIIEEEVRISNKKSDLDIYKKRLEKYINDNNIPIIIQL